MPADPQTGDSPGVGEAPFGHAPAEPVIAAEAEQPAPAEAEAPTPPTPIQPVVDVHDLDWDGIAASVVPGAVRARMRRTVEQLETVLDSESGLRMLFDEQRENRADPALKILAISDTPLWFIGDLHGDLLTLEPPSR